MKQDRFPYSVTTSAPSGYPIEVHLGYFTDDKNQLICGVPKTGIERSGWQWDGDKGGQSGSVIPAHIDLTYVAYAEKKFYHVDADLPREKFLEVFKKGFYRMERSGKIVHENFTTLNVGMAPGGVVVIWLSGGSNNRVEICRLQAKETFVDVNDFYQNADDENQQQFFDSWFKIAVPDSIQQEIKTNGIPLGLWDQYRERYKYRFVLNPYDDEDRFTHNYYLYFNGEADEFFQEDLNKNEYITKGIPYRCTFMMTKYNLKIIFNDVEMLSVFAQLQKNHPGKPIDIVIVPAFMYTDFTLSVKCENEEIPLTQYKVDSISGG